MEREADRNWKRVIHRGANRSSRPIGFVMVPTSPPALPHRARVSRTLSHTIALRKSKRILRSNVERERERRERSPGIYRQDSAIPKDSLFPRKKKKMVIARLILITLLLRFCTLTRWLEKHLSWIVFASVSWLERRNVKFYVKMTRHLFATREVWLIVMITGEPSFLFLYW